MATRSIEDVGERAGRKAPAALATPTTVDKRGVEEIAKAINPIIADAFALYVKTKNFHWHLSGPRFRDLHLLFDEQAEAVFASIDPLAERMRRIGATTLHSIGEIEKLAAVRDDDDEFVGPQEMVRRLLRDNRGIAERQHAAIEICDKHHDDATSNLLQEIVNGTERRVWFLFEITQEQAA